MGKILLVLTVIIGSVLLWFYAKPTEVVEKVTRTVTNAPKIDPQKEVKKYEFVPYWSFTKNIVTNSDYSLIYFGLGVNEKGIDISDQGYQKMKSFVDLTPNASERILAIKMVDKNINAQILKDLEVQRNIASQAVEFANENKFDGVLLDYETSAFGFDSTTNNISSFYELFAKKVKDNKLLFYVTLYGDTKFRARPYDLKKIGALSDRVLIMAYDFSKSKGNPGPNFPLIDNGTYGYDFQRMIEDFQKDIDNQKIVVTLGYFGYDWRIDKKGEAVASGVPLSTNEIGQEFVEDCQYKSCSLNRTSGSEEPSVQYIDEGGQSHMVWFEDIRSANKKIEVLSKKGILETAFWAYSYY